MKRMMIFLILASVAVSASATPKADWLSMAPSMQAIAVQYLIAGWIASDLAGGPEGVSRAKRIVAVILRVPKPGLTNAVVETITAYYDVKTIDHENIVDAFMVSFGIVMKQLSQRYRIISAPANGTKPSPASIVGG